MSTNSSRKISCQTLWWYHRMFTDQNADAALALARRCGFDAIDYHFEGLYSYNEIVSGAKNPVYNLPSEKLIEYYTPLKNAMDAHGISISQAHGISPFYVPGKDDINKYLYTVVDKILEVCRFLGCPLIVQHPPRGLTADEMIEVSKPLIPAAIRTGVKICIENMFAEDGQGNVYPYFTAEDACYIVDTLNASAGAQVFGICYDTGHANISGRNHYDDIHTYDSRLMCMHIHENDGRHDQHMIPFTQKNPDSHPGCIEWESVIKALCEIGYRGPINCEVHPAFGIAPPELLESMMRLTASVCGYFRDRLDNQI